MLSFLKRDKNNPKPAQGDSAGGWLSRLREGLAATRGKLGGQLSALLGRHTVLGTVGLEAIDDLGVGPVELVDAERLLAGFKRMA